MHPAAIQRGNAFLPGRAETDEQRQVRKAIQARIRAGNEATFAALLAQVGGAAEDEVKGLLERMGDAEDWVLHAMQAARRNGGGFWSPATQPRPPQRARKKKGVGGVEEGSFVRDGLWRTLSGTPTLPSLSIANKPPPASPHAKKKTGYASRKFPFGGACCSAAAAAAAGAASAAAVAAAAAVEEEDEDPVP